MRQLTIQTLPPPKRQSPFKKPAHPDWPSHNISYPCFFPRQIWRCLECGKQRSEQREAEACHGQAEQRWVADGVAPQCVWDAGQAMRHLWNTLYLRFNRLRDAEPMACVNGHAVSGDQIYDEKGRGAYCMICRDEGKDRARVWSSLRGKARGDHYRPFLASINSVAQSYAEHWRCAECGRIAVESAEANACHGQAERRDLPSSCYYSVAFRFSDTVRKWLGAPQQFKQPRFKPSLESIRITQKFSDGGQPVRRFINESGCWAGLTNTLALKSKPGEPLTPEYLHNGYLMLGGQKGERIDLHAAYHTPLPGTNPALLDPETPDDQLTWAHLAERHLAENALVKEIVLSGKRVSGFNKWTWNVIYTVQAPFPVKPVVGNGVFSLDLGWRRMDADDVTGAPSRLRVGAIYDGHAYHEIFVPFDLTNRRERKNENRHRENRKLVAPTASWELESRIGDGIQAVKEDIAGLDKSVWPADAMQTWAGNVKMREQGLLKLRRQLAHTGIVEPMIEEWLTEYAMLLRWNRHLEIAIRDRRDRMYRNIADGLAKQCRVMIIDCLAIEEKKRRPKKRKEARKEKYAKTGAWDARTRDERIEENAAKYRDFAAISRFRQFLREACFKHGVQVIEHTHDNSCANCGEPIDFQEALHAACGGCGRYQEKNRNSALDVWQVADVEGKEKASRFDLALASDQARRGLRLMVSPLARTSSDDGEAAGSRGV